MKISETNLSIADYCGMFGRNEVVVDYAYQRSPKVWPDPVRSYLIETILKEYPIPKLALHQVTDLRSRQTIKRVVDGQQRTMAILDFYSGKLRLSRRLELDDAVNRTYAELPEDLQRAFLGYSLNFDQFENATDEEVREYFRRINSFTAPLNAEENRHARYQGAMKWFMVRMSQRFGNQFINLGVLPKNRVIRMGDVKLLAEIIHALLNGITTTSKTTLDAMYSKYDKGDQLPEESELSHALDAGFESILGWNAIRSTPLMRMNVFYSLFLATVRVRLAWPTLMSIITAPLDPTAFHPRAETNLLTLAAALDEPEDSPQYKELTDAAAEKTNVKASRETRTRWLVRALTNTL